jgi:dual specificity MAP kinase phosphatase
MATIALTRPLLPHGPPDSINPALSLETVPKTNVSSSGLGPLAIPNKHLPNCPTGPANAIDLDTPPPSPKTHGPSQSQSSLLYPPAAFSRIASGPLAIYEIDASIVASALDFASRQPLPDPSVVFPWFHGLHPSNHVQQSFFSARRRLHRKTPLCLRGITLVKADGDLNRARLKGAIAPEELLRSDGTSEFIDPDPRDGFSVRNFHIQPTKSALTSDIVVYGDDSIAARTLAWERRPGQMGRRQRLRRARCPR